MNNAQKSFILFLLLFIQNHQPIFSIEEDDNDEFFCASAYIPKSPLAYDHDEDDFKAKKVTIPVRLKRSSSLGRYKSEIPETFMPSEEIVAIIEQLKAKNQESQQ